MHPAKAPLWNVTCVHLPRVSLEAGAPAAQCSSVNLYEPMVQNIGMLTET